MTTAAFPLPQHYFEALRRFDRRGAARLVQDYLDGGGHIEGLFVDVLMPAMILTGEEWEAARISVAHEHYISEVTRDLIHQYGHETWTVHSPEARWRWPAASGRTAHPWSADDQRYASRRGY